MALLSYRNPVDYEAQLGESTMLPQLTTARVAMG
jgi:hypothetical protein